jgi:hypothetical protein
MRTVCDGSGATQEVVDDDDLPDDGNDCTEDSCQRGAPQSEPVGPGASCATGLCDGMGSCVECNVPSDCAGSDDECQERTCEANQCGVAFTDAMTPVTMQTGGDCMINVCDGQGATEAVVDDGDLPVDFNDCTDDVCASGTPSNPPFSQGQACGTSGICDGAGSCVGCVAPTDCPGTDDFCKQRTCSNNVCGFQFTAMSTPLPQQTAGDCQSLVCNGAGAVQSIAANGDTPVDGQQCTSDLCTNGVPSNPPLSAGTACSQNGGSLCSPTGQCVECNVPSNCPAPGACKTATCTNDTCGVANEPAGTICGAGSCSGGVQQNADTCNSSGSCVDGGSTTCSPYVCGPSACTSSCVGNGGCASGFSCDTLIEVCTSGPKCTDYCNAVQASCTASATEQYTSMQSCLEVCQTLPPGTSGAGSGQSIGCRTTHAGLAMTDPVTHCPHAGPGGDGACGANCDSFCTIAQALCTGNNQQFSSLTACMTECGGFATTPKYSTSATGDNFACRLYHLTQAAIDPNTHCSHIPTSSPLCI